MFLLCFINLLYSKFRCTAVGECAPLCILFSFFLLREEKVQAKRMVVLYVNCFTECGLLIVTYNESFSFNFYTDYLGWS